MALCLSSIRLSSNAEDLLMGYSAEYSTGAGFLGWDHGQKSAGAPFPMIQMMLRPLGESAHPPALGVPAWDR